MLYVFMLNMNVDVFMLNRYRLYVEHSHCQGQGRKGISLWVWCVCCPDLEHMHMDTHTLHAGLHRKRGKAWFFCLYRAHVLPL